MKRFSIPYTIVHATQFFEFMNGIADQATDGNAARLPPAHIKPMAADDVASALARVAVDPPLNRRVEIVGPDQFRLDELLRRLLKERDDPREAITNPPALRRHRAERAHPPPGNDAQIANTTSTTG
jgi:uncharacterized protein YbjT (DUF2867 family)